MASSTLRRKVGALLYDAPRFARSMLSGPRGWTAMHNRRERTTRDAATGGERCEWVFASDLDLARTFPSTARWLLRRALAEWPIELADAPPAAAQPDVSFIIGHRGSERLPLLLKTLASIAAQRDAAIECIVVEQSAERVAEPRLPPWVRYLHTPVPPDMPYNRSATFNAGVAIARAPVLILHDNDMLVPAHYAREAAARVGDGFELLDLKRFIFYLSRESSERVLAAAAVPTDVEIGEVTQNLLGGSIVATREAYDAIGGFDESFVGWGGEDNEFWERAQTRRTWGFAYLPIVHLWHAPQPEKAAVQASGKSRHADLSRIAPEERIARLLARRRT